MLTHSESGLCSSSVIGTAGKYYYSSGLAYPDSHLKERWMCRFYRFAVPLLSTEKLECIPFGGQTDRTNKTLVPSPTIRLPENISTLAFPDMGGADNCSVCRKCCRTLLTFEIQDRIAAFAAVFDLRKYQAVRNRFIFKVLRKPAGTL
ncbi:MAG: hypothetical protein U5Q16_09530 [Gammaproteobacteria bacterium]|nr:hypothetical protein [Gammaproteobacteria bacterium]